MKSINIKLHDNVCRYDEAYPLQADNAPAPSFADCYLAKDPNNILVYRNSSDFARTACCLLCETALSWIMSGLSQKLFG